MKARSTEDGSPGVSALLLAGGRSRRMPGINKAFAEINGRPMIEYILDTLKTCFESVYIVAKDRSLYAHLGVAVIADRLPVQSPLAGMHAGFSAVESDYLFCCACDTPLMTPALIQTLLEEIQPAMDVIVPRLGTYYQPLCAIYSRRCLPVIDDLLGAGEVKVDRLYREVVVHEVPEQLLRRVDPHQHAFINVNTPADLEAVAALMKTSP
jgi:molybdopterin-guanine dinucleotide biosynthesis protein A